MSIIIIHTINTFTMTCKPSTEDKVNLQQGFDKFINRHWLLDFLPSRFTVSWSRELTLPLALLQQRKLGALTPNIHVKYVHWKKVGNINTIHLKITQSGHGTVPLLHLGVPLQTDDKKFSGRFTVSKETSTVSFNGIYVTTISQWMHCLSIS